MRKAWKVFAGSDFPVLEGRKAARQSISAPTSYNAIIFTFHFCSKKMTLRIYSHLCQDQELPLSFLSEDLTSVKCQSGFLSNRAKCQKTEIVRGDFFRPPLIIRGGGHALKVLIYIQISLQ